MGFLTQGCFLSVDILDRTKYQGLFGMNQMSVDILDKTKHPLLYLT